MCWCPGVREWLEGESHQSTPARPQGRSVVFDRGDAEDALVLPSGSPAREEAGCPGIPGLPGSSGRPGQRPAQLRGTLGGAPASRLGRSSPRRPCPRPAGHGDWLASAPPLHTSLAGGGEGSPAGSWPPPPLQCLPPCAPAGIMGGPPADAPEEAGRGRAGRAGKDEARQDAGGGAVPSWISGGWKKEK